MIFLNGDPEVFIHFLLEMRISCCGDVCACNKFVRLPPLKIVQDDAFVVAEFHSRLVESSNDGLNPCNAMCLPGYLLKFEMISCCHHVLGVSKYSPKCFVVRSVLRCFRELPSSLLKF